MDVAKPIRTHSVSKILTEAAPYCPTLWSEETVTKAAEAARTAKTDQTFRLFSDKKTLPKNHNTNKGYQPMPRLPNGFSFRRPSHRANRGFMRPKYFPQPRLPTGLRFGRPAFPGPKHYNQAQERNSYVQTTPIQYRAPQKDTKENSNNQVQSFQDYQGEALQPKSQMQSHGSFRNKPYCKNQNSRGQNRGRGRGCARSGSQQGF